MTHDGRDNTVSDYQTSLRWPPRGDSEGKETAADTEEPVLNLPSVFLVILLILVLEFLVKTANYCECAISLCHI